MTLSYKPKSIQVIGFDRFDYNFLKETGTCRINVERQAGNPSKMAFKVDTGGFSKTCDFDAFAKATAYITVDRPGANIQFFTHQFSKSQKPTS